MDLNMISAAMDDIDDDFVELTDELLEISDPLARQNLIQAVKLAAKNLEIVRDFVRTEVRKKRGKK